MHDFAEQLQHLKIAFYSHSYSFHFSNWLGYRWKGFTQTTLFTYRIDLAESLEEITANIHKRTKKEIHNTKKELIVTHNEISNNKFWEINKMTFDRQSLDVPYSYEVLDKLITEAQKRNAAAKLSVEDSSGQIISCMLLVFDSQTCYTLTSGSNPNLRHTNATTLINYEAIRYAKERNCLVLDFAGSVMERAEPFIRRFGGIQTPYNLIEKRYSRLYSFLRSFKN
jgi:lipid II:glycine glycyltransferase (peptidoglycan interpeptide bridge formation enzyme)